ncbi:MAG TPA: hemolysin family protein [Verrucomicrobiae bacterium]|jgi:CBS domain containing-hemolysin-like protein
MNGDALAANALHLLGILAIVLVNGFFVAAEFAFVKLRDTQLDALIVAGHRRAKVARHISRNLTSYLGATQLGITMASLGLGWLAEPVFLALLSPPLQWLGVASPQFQKSAAFALGFAAATFLQIVLGELGPKWFAIQRALPVALALASPLDWFYRASYPFNWILNRSAEWLLRRAGIEPASSPLMIHTEEELRLMLNQSRAGATGLGREIILNALDLRHRIVRNVMRPRMEITAFDTEAPLSECREIAEKTRYSRFLLCEGGDLDKTLGVIHIKDLFALRSQAGRGKDLAAAARKLIYVPETTRLEKLLQLFLERKVHLAVVVDEYGGTVGMVTLENVLEELVGQIQDEFDQEKPLLLPRGPDQWEIDGALPLHELAELVGQNLYGDNVATTSGWVTQRLGGFPKVGDTLALGACTLRVDRLDGMVVKRLSLTRVPGVPKSAE